MTQETRDESEGHDSPGPPGTQGEPGYDLATHKLVKDITLRFTPSPGLGTECKVLGSDITVYGEDVSTLLIDMAERLSTESDETIAGLMVAVVVSLDAVEQAVANSAAPG